MMQPTFPCPKCGSQNAIGQRFCTGCGERFEYRCAHCGTITDSTSRFCQNCGAAVGGEGPQQPGWVSQQPQSVPPTPRSQTFSSTQLLILLLVVLSLGLGGLVYWQFGSQPSTADTTPLIISNVSVLAKGKSSATIVWKTDKAASSQVEYGKTPSYGSLSPPQPQNDPTSGSPGVTTHSVTLTGLKSGTTYYFRVKSKDAAGNEAILPVSPDKKTFKTEESTGYRWDF